jgi:hypothetical protein
MYSLLDRRRDADTREVTTPEKGVGQARMIEAG